MPFQNRILPLVAAGLVLASCVVSTPAHASTGAAAPTVIATVGDTTTTLSITGDAGASAAVSTAAGRIIAGTSLGPTGARIVIPTPATESLYRVTQTVGGTVSTAAEVLVREGQHTDPAALSIDRVETAHVSTSSVVSISGQPSATVTLRSSKGESVAVKKIGASGTAQVSLSKSVASLQGLSATQSMGDAESEASTYVTPLARADVSSVREYTQGLAATVYVSGEVTLQGTKAVIVDAEGREVLRENIPRWGKTVQLPLTSDVTNEFTAYSEFDGHRSAGVPLSIDGHEQNPVIRSAKVTEEPSFLRVEVRATPGLTVKVDPLDATIPGLGKSGPTVLYTGPEGRDLDGAIFLLDKRYPLGERFAITASIDGRSTTEVVTLSD